MTVEYVAQVAAIVAVPLLIVHILVAIYFGMQHRDASR